jgi:hypothetical protein
VVGARKLSCEERNAILLDPATGLVAEGWKVHSSLTDADGEYGEPRIETLWGRGDVRVRDVRHPKLGSYTPPDERPCEHFVEAGGTDD